MKDVYGWLVSWMAWLLIPLMSLFLIPKTQATDSGGELQIVWPTPNAAFDPAIPPEDFLQPTESGEWQSALFGCYRNGGKRFHEAIDLKATKRNRRGEATDAVFAAMGGVVVHASHVAGRSSYGRYIVIEHRQYEPAVYTLYAHLASIHDGLEIGNAVKAGEKIAVMGRSAMGYSIPKSRAHLHFEVGLLLSDDFQSWYDWKEFKDKNYHGNYNGMNLLGMEPLGFLRQGKAGTIQSPLDYINEQATAFTLRIHTAIVPDFVKRYPALVEGKINAPFIIAWEVDFTAYGLPKQFRPVHGNRDAEGIPEAGSVALLYYSPEAIDPFAAKDMLRLQEGKSPAMGNGIKQVLEILFGFR